MKFFHINVLLFVLLLMSSVSTTYAAEDKTEKSAADGAKNVAEQATAKEPAKSIDAKKADASDTLTPEKKEPAAPKKEESKKEEPKKEEPKKEEPKKEEPKKEEPKKEEPKKEEPKKEEPKKEEPKKEEPKKEEPKKSTDSTNDFSAKFKVETVLTGLDNPSGIALRPGGTKKKYEIFVSDSAGLRIIKMLSTEPNKAIEVVTGFAESTYGKGPVYKIGPLGLTFLSKDRLVVGGGGLADGAEVIRLFKLPADGSALTVDQAEGSFGPIKAGKNSENGEGNFYALTSQKNAIYITSNGDDKKGWILKAPLTAGKPTKLETFIATKEAIAIDAPAAIAISNGGYLVVGQMGEIKAPKDSRLSFYNPFNGKLQLDMATGLHDLVGLAYTPNKDRSQRRLYGVDFAWMEESAGGVYIIIGTQTDENKPGCTTLKIASVNKPTALVFGPDGALYVTAFGKTKEGEKTGVLLKITGEF